MWILLGSFSDGIFLAGIHSQRTGQWFSGSVWTVSSHMWQDQLGMRRGIPRQIITIHNWSQEDSSLRRLPLHRDKRIILRIKVLWCLRFLVGRRRRSDLGVRCELSQNSTKDSPLKTYKYCYSWNGSRLLLSVLWKRDFRVFLVWKVEPRSSTCWIHWECMDHQELLGSLLGDQWVRLYFKRSKLRLSDRVRDCLDFKFRPSCTKVSERTVC